MSSPQPLQLPSEGDALQHSGEQPTPGALPQLVCCYCTPHHVMREGSLPASHGMCDIAYAKADAELTALEAGGKAVPVDDLMLAYGRAIQGGLDLIFGGKGQRELVDVPPASHR